jgi:hypothetical protein
MEIKGTINFSLTREADGQMKLSYDQNLENDIGALAVAQSVMAEMENHFKRMKSASKQKLTGAPALKDANENLARVSKGLSAMQHLTGYNIHAYEQWTAEKAKTKKSQEEKETSAGKE